MHPFVTALPIHLRYGKGYAAMSPPRFGAQYGRGYEAISNMASVLLGICFSLLWRAPIPQGSCSHVYGKGYAAFCQVCGLRTTQYGRSYAAICLIHALGP